MNARGFAILLVFAVAASVAWGLLVERFTAPGLERTIWFGIGLAGIIFPAGRYAERRGWIKGTWRGAESSDRNAATPSVSESPAPAAGPIPASDTRPSSGDKP